MSSSLSLSPLSVASAASCWRRIGCLGGGQLGRMLALAAAPLGAKVTVLDPTNNCPASQVCAHISGSFSDAAAIAQLAAVSDVLTVEIEHVDADALETAQKQNGIPVHPSPSTIRMIQDKYLQKQHMSKHGVAIGRYTIIQNKQHIQEAAQVYGLPLMLKSRRLAYDGRGNFLLRSVDDIDRAITSLQSSAKSQPNPSDLMLYAEEYVPFECELAVMVARAMDGTTRSYPCVTTVQRDNICHTVWAPALVDGAIRKRAEELAMKAIQALDGAGVYGVELFMLKDGSLLLNEIAPRPHNSGHYTIEACETSQFEQQARAVLGLPLGSCDMRVGAAVMINVLGTGSNNATVDLANTWLTCACALTTAGGSVHWYGKNGIVKGRKLGHVTLTGSSTIELLDRYHHVTTAVQQFTQATSDASPSTTEHKSSDMSLPPLVGIIMGSDSDLPSMKAAAEILTEFRVPFELTIVSAHRTPDRLVSYARSARARGIKVIIAAAGGAAHLPGMVAALTPLPVIGVPIPLTHLDGVDSLYSIVQMPRGVPCATVAIGNSTNGALLAVRMLSTSMPHLADHMERYQQNMEQQVMDKVHKIQQQGWRTYKP